MPNPAATRLHDQGKTSSTPTAIALHRLGDGAARRFCRVVWRKPTQMGVKFERSLADAANATLAPKSDADVPAPDDAAAPAIAEPAKTE